MIVVNKNILWRAVLAVMIAVTLTFIWSSSLKNAELSSDMSNSVIEIIKPIIDPQDKIADALFVKIVRKTAHFAEFALLGAEVFLLFKTFDRWKQCTLPSFILPISVSFVCAVTDELLQLTSYGRSCEFTDMMIDLAGIVTGVLISAVLYYVINKYSEKAG